MMFIIVILTVAMVLDCVVLIGLVLIQLPKKDTGGGLAFGGSASDALFGAGSGNVLTKVTQYAAGIFFALAVLLSVLQKSYHANSTTEFQRMLTSPGLLPHPSAPQAPAPTASTPSTNPLTSTLGATNGFTLTMPVTNAASSNAAPAPTNAAPAPKQ
jgi:preprotein translocase subunit SecG